MSRMRIHGWSGDPTPLTGGLKTPPRLLRPIPDPGVAAPADPLDKHILRLLTLHTDVAVRFPGVDLATMDDAAKRALLADIQALLGVKPVRFPTA